MKIFNKNARTYTSESGISLLEMLLTVGILSIVFITITDITQRITEREVANAVAGYMRIVQDDAEQMVSSVQRFNAFFTAADAAASDTIQVPINDPGAGVLSVARGGTITGVAVPPGGAVSQNFRKELPLAYGDEATVIVRAQTVGGERSLIVMVVTLGRIPEESLRRFAQYIGPKGGYVSALASDGAGVCANVLTCIRSSYALWADDLADFNGTAWAATVTVTPPTLNDGGYLVSYRMVKESDIMGDYLYRQGDPDEPELNRMYWDMDMANNSVVGADNVFVSSDGTKALLGDFTVAGELHARGSVFAQDLNVVGDVEVERDAHVFGDMTLQPQYTGAAGFFEGFAGRGTLSVERQLEVRGNLTVDETMQADTALLRNAIVNDSVRSDTATIRDLLVNQDAGAGGIFATDFRSPADMTVEDDMRAGSVDLTGAASLVTTGNVSALSLSAKGGAADTSTIQNIQGDGGISVPRVRTRNLDIDLLSDCISGC